MSVSAASDPVLRQFRHKLAEMYGDRLVKAVLHGSRARGDWTGESDYDVAVFLKDLPDWWREANRLADLRVEFFDRSGEFLDAKPYDIAEWAERTALMAEIRRDGIAF